MLYLTYILYIATSVSELWAVYSFLVVHFVCYVLSVLQLLSVSYEKSWPEPYICTVYYLQSGDFPAKNTVYTPCILLWSTLRTCDVLCVVIQIKRTVELDQGSKAAHHAAYSLWIAMSVSELGKARPLKSSRAWAKRLLSLWTMKGSGFRCLCSCLVTFFLQKCICVGLARTVYMHRIWPCIWWFSCQKYRIHTVYIYMVLANPIYVCSVWQF